jgi:TolB protein
MKTTSAVHISPLHASLVAVALATVAALPASVNATFEGKPGPIAFQRFTDPNDDGSAQIFRVKPGGERVRQLTALPGGGFHPDYSPNGGRILFNSAFEDTGAIFNMRADGSDPVRLNTGCSGECLGDEDPAWSPNGRRIVFERAFGPIVDDNASALDLMIARADGSRAHVVRHFPLVGGGPEPHAAEWSPNGRRLAVMLLNVSEPGTPSAVYVLRPDGTHLRRITPFSLNAGNPDWSPSGKRIVFNSSYEGQAAAEIYTVRPDGSHMRLVHALPEDHYAFEPVFSPSGKRIAFTERDEEGLPHIHTMRRNGSRVRQITHGPVVDVAPDWGARRGA